MLRVLDSELSDLTYKWLTGQEAIDAIDPVLQERGWAALNAATRPAVRCAFNEQSRCIGFCVFQFFNHVGPQWVADDYRGTGVSAQLAEDMWNFLEDAQCRGFMVVADSPHSEKLCKARGMTLVTSPVYVFVRDEKKGGAS